MRICVERSITNDGLRRHSFHRRLRALQQALVHAVFRYGEALEELLRDPNSDLIPFREKGGRLVDAEWDLRYNKKLNRYIKKATLKYPHADLDDTIYDPERLLNAKIIEELFKCKWIEQGRNLMITGRTGSGKSYMGNALAVSALRQFKTVKYCKAG